MWSRQAFLGEETMLPELPAIGRSKQDAAVQGLLQPHDHAHAYEVVLVESGQLRWWVKDEELTLSAGMLFLTRPGETHGAVDRVLEPSEIRWAQFRLDIDQAFGIDHELRAELRESLNQANRTGRASDIHRHHLKSMLSEHQRNDWRPDLVCAHAVCFLEEAAISLNQPHLSKIDARIIEAQKLMRGNLGQTISVRHVAAHVDLSESWFHQLFQRSTGLTVADWMARERIEQAKSLLSGSAISITEIALELGFSSSQYFATVFKKLTGQTPRDFRREYSVQSATKDLPNAVRIVPYDPSWPAIFEAERQRLLELPNYPFRELEHIGSTSVPGLDAKPIIDIMTAVEKLDEINDLLSSLKNLGYTELDGGFRFRRVFVRSDSGTIDGCHLHIVTREAWTDKSEKLFRDRLHEHPTVALRYADLKHRMARKYANSPTQYTRAKGAFIREVVNEARRAIGLPRRTDWQE